MNSPILHLKTHMTVKRMRQCFEAYDDWARKDAQDKLTALDKSDTTTLGPKIKEIVEEASGRIADAAAELSEGMRLRSELRGIGGFR
jgi:hypothetical protein